MSRKQPVAGPSISLFPFLAVLLCTMGSLLVLLVLFSRAANQGEAVTAVEGETPLEQELEVARDGLAWRSEQLVGVRDRTAESLARARVQLAGIEEHSRQLQDEFERLERAAASLLSSRADDGLDERAVRVLEERLRSARESLEQARKEHEDKPPAYAVVPYSGNHGTHRRPLYIECCGDGVFLQPEGIRLGPGDFEGPPGPGNPLACALRVAREHVVSAQGGTTDPAAQPYPLLLVRPSGVLAYYAAREAIQSWGSDFGYQLIDEDWPLAFPPADPLLAQLEKRAIDEARARLAWLAEVRSTKPARPVRQYRAAPTRGGVVSDGGPSVLGDQSRWEWGNQRQSPQGDLTAGAAGQRGGGSGPAAGGDVPGSEPGGAGSTLTDGGGGDPVLGRDPIGGPQGRSAAGDGVAVGAMVPAGRDGRAATGSAANDAAGDGGTSGPGTAGIMKEADGVPRGRVRGGPESGSSEGTAASTSSGQAGGGGNTAGPPMPGLVQAGASGGGMQAAADTRSGAASFAQTRGKNWASLATPDRPIPITRPIRIECAADEFRLLDDAGRRVQTRIVLDADTATAIDPLIGAIHARVQAWGIAGERMYWRPQLVLSETTDGRSRREDLERLLADSGIDTRRRDAHDRIRPLPPVGHKTAYVPRR